MTNEKTIRTREEQVQDCTNELSCNGMSRTWGRSWSEKMIRKAEERGAAQAWKTPFLESVSSASDRIVDRADVLQWQKDNNQFFDATILEIVTEYADWRDKKETKASAEDAKGQEPIAVYVAELEARIKELEAQLKKVTTPTWYCSEGEEDGGNEIASAVGPSFPFNIEEVDGWAPVKSFWVFYDNNYSLHIFNTDEEAVSALAAMKPTDGETP